MPSPRLAGQESGRPHGWLIAAIWLVTFLVYSPTINHGFINFDDPPFVIENPMVNGGLNWAGIGQAFVSAPARNWQPLTWMTHMLDCSLYGLAPWGHHLGNVLLHSCNAALLFLLMTRITGSIKRSLVVAALFALHPLRVESVAWVTSRKDVLSGCFWMLSMLAYASYVRGGPRRHWAYLLSLGSFALGLMSKSTVIMLPVVLLLLDWWPLRRLHWSNAKALILEKIPFFVTSAMAALLVIKSHSPSPEDPVVVYLALVARWQHAVVSYLLYLSKFFVPVNLAVFYPHPGWHPLWLLLASGLGILALSILAFRFGKRHPSFLVGWFWFLASLLPSVGLIDFGDHSIADRFSYLTLIGLAITLVWLGADLASGWGISVKHKCLAAVIGLVGCALLTSLQINCWRSTEQLFRHTASVTGPNELANIQLGVALFENGKEDEARQAFEAAAKAAPGSGRGYYHLGAIQLKLGRNEEAVRAFQSAVKLQPNRADFYFGLATAQLAAGMLAEAALSFQQTLYLVPQHAEAHLKLGNLFYGADHYAEANTHFRAYLRLRPQEADAHNNVASLLFAEGKLAEAIPFYREALRLNPQHKEALQNFDALLKIQAGQPVR